MGPRSLSFQDRLGSTFSPLPFSFRFLIVFGSVLVPFGVPKWIPKVAPNCRGGGPWGVQGGLGLVLVRSFVRLVARCCFLDPLALLLGPFWEALGPIFGHLRPSWGHLGPSWGHLGPTWSHLGPFLGNFGAILGYPGAIWGLSSGLRGSFGILLGGLLASLGPLGRALHKQWRGSVSIIIINKRMARRTARKRLNPPPSGLPLVPGVF